MTKIDSVSFQRISQLVNSTLRLGDKLIYNRSAADPKWLLGLIITRIRRQDQLICDKSINDHPAQDDSLIDQRLRQQKDQRQLVQGQLTPMQPINNFSLLFSTRFNHSDFWQKKQLLSLGFEPVVAPIEWNLRPLGESASLPNLGLKPNYSLNWWLQDRSKLQLFVAQIVADRTIGSVEIQKPI